MKKIITVLMLIISLGMFSINVKAIEQNGGINLYGNTSANSKQETQLLEQTLKTNNYICVSGKNREISDEDFDKFFKNSIPYGEYATKDKESFSYEYKKIYVYKPYFDKAMEYAKERKPLAVDDLETKIFRTTVLIDYAEWEEKDNVGKVVNEYNDNIPKTKQNSVAYIQITTPFSIKLQMKSISYSSFNEIALKKGVTTIKMLQRGYKITKINNIDINSSEKILPYNNNIQLTKENTEENPYKVDLTKVLEEYNITSLADETNTLENQDQNNNENNTNLEETNNSVIVPDVDNNVEKTIIDENFLFTKFISIPILAWLIIGIVIIVLIIFIIIKKKKKF